MTATRSRLALAGLTVVALLVAGCGSGLSGPRAVLSSATSNIGTIRAGGLSVRFALTPNAAPADTVGIVIRGSFALDRRDRLPIANVAFTRLAGSESSTTRIDSNGQSATIGSASGRRVPLTTSQRQILAATVQGPQGLGNLPLHLDSWVANPHQTPGPVMGGQRTDEITGTVDLPSAINDLNQITGGQVTKLRDRRRSMTRCKRPCGPRASSPWSGTPTICCVASTSGSSSSPPARPRRGGPLKA